MGEARDGLYEDKMQLCVVKIMSKSNISTTTWSIEPHTQAKHEILKRYLQAWYPILSKFNGRILYIDGFAGPGEYSNGELGSPIIAINEAKNHTLKLNTEILFLFIEANKDRYEHLKNVASEIDLPNNIKYEIICSKFDETLISLFDNLNEQEKRIAPTFAFIDPFGFSDTPFSVIERLLSYKKCEVLITFMSGFMNRFKGESPKNKHFDALLGTPDWRHVITENSDAGDIVTFYQNTLKSVAKHVYSFEMINKFNQTLFHLIFCTNSIKGLKEMKRAMWKVDETGTFSFSDNTDPYQTVLFEHEPDYQHLKRLILNKFKGKMVSTEEIENFVIAETPYRETHFKTQILKPMEHANPPEIEILCEKKRRNGTYPDGTNIIFL